ncbi:MAG: hypothetical protein WCK53_14680 [Methanomicrobiales archaeon]
MNKRQIESQMKVGAGLALFGLVCPFFWLSLFSGNSSSGTWVYGAHTCIFIVIGFAFLGKGWYDLKRFRAIPQINNSNQGI